MFSQAVLVTLRLLLFRAGPQDFPYSAVLTQGIVAVALFVTSLLFSTLIPGAQALIFALGIVAAMAVTTQLVLKPRGMQNRFQQTFNSLLAVFAVHGLLLLPAFLELAPFVLKVVNDPVMLDRIRQGQAVEIAVPAVASLWSDLIFVWSFAVTLNIFRQATNVGIVQSLLMTLSCAVATFFFVLIAGLVVGILFGTGV